MEIEEIKKIEKGDILHDSWGYDQTNNEYCEVLENTSKTIKCQKVGKKKIGDISPAYGQEVVPNPEVKICKPFRIKISKSKQSDEAWLIGSHPLFESDCSQKIRGSWDKWDGKPDIDTER